MCIITFQFLIVSYFHSVHNHTKQILRHEANGSNGVKSKSLGVGFHRVFLDSKAVVDPVFLWLRAMTKFGFGGFFFIFFIVIAWVGGLRARVRFLLSCDESAFFAFSLLIWVLARWIRVSARAVKSHEFFVCQSSTMNELVDA